MRAEPAFDTLAPDYDASFTGSTIGRAMRRAVHRRLDALFQPGDRVLDLGCGTGEDALYLARRGIAVEAVERSPEMVIMARAKVERAGLGELIEVRGEAIEPALLGRSPDLDGALSNFGALNCVEDLEVVADGLASALRPGAVAALCVMGPWVPWEWGWFLRLGQPRGAFRRLRRGGIPWRGLMVRYPSIGSVRRVFRGNFRCRRVAAVGALVPPSYAETWARRHPRWLERLERWERRHESRWPLPWLADHYLIELERR